MTPHLQATWQQWKEHISHNTAAVPNTAMLLLCPSAGPRTCLGEWAPRAPGNPTRLQLTSPPTWHYPRHTREAPWLHTSIPTLPAWIAVSNPLHTDHKFKSGSKQHNHQASQASNASQLKSSFLPTSKTDYHHTDPTASPLQRKLCKRCRFSKKVT